MPTRTQRRRNQEARDVAEQAERYKNGLPNRAEEKLTMRRDFVVEAIRDSRLVSLTFQPWGQANILDIYGGNITFDGRSKLYGDTVVNNWQLPKIKGYRVQWFKDSSTLVTKLSPSFSSLDVSNIWLRTVEELLNDPITLDSEEDIVVSGDGLTIIAQNLGHNAMRGSLEYINAQLFE